MREFFIGAFETLVSVIIILMAALVALMGVVTMFGGGMTGPGGHHMDGVLPGLLILFIGAVCVVFIGGVMYLGLGVYDNTRRSAELLEQIASRRNAKPPAQPRELLEWR